MSEITLITADGRPGARPWLCVQHCLAAMPAGFFAAAKVCCPSEPPPGPYEWIPFPQGDVHAYSRFCMQELEHHVVGTHVLVVQNDGYIIHPDLWNPEWLQYDYIGAPWPVKWARRIGRHRVGNGGFSLRSRALVSECSRLKFWEGINEDIQICQIHRDRLEERGMKFAPLEVAQRFAVEWDPVPGNTFGFHGCTGRDGRLRLQ
jgi:hypothetical protein